MLKNPCGTARANIINKNVVNGIPVYFGTGVAMTNSLAQFFVAWGKDVLTNGLIHTYNEETPEKGILWFTDEDQAEAEYNTLQQTLAKKHLALNQIAIRSSGC